MNNLRFAFAWLPAFLAGSCLVTGVQAALVGTGGYANDFSTQPAAADWSHFSIAGAAADVTTAAGIDNEMLSIAASSITSQTLLDAGNPPALNASATWSSSGFYLQTRPTGNRATLLMCTLVNNVGSAAGVVRISYDFTAAAPAGDEISGHNTYYSLTGVAGSWVLIPELSFASTSGRLTANLSLNWPAGGTLYLLWADDNSAPSPDTANQIDNFSALVPAETPVAITSQPQSLTVGELAPASFTVVASGEPRPTYQWYKNNLPITDATNVTYSIASAPLSDHNAQFQVVAANTASNVNYSVTSSPPAVLMVNADTTPPTLLRAIGVPSTTVSVDFSERVRADTANVTGNYAITSSVGNLTVSTAVLAPNGSNVVLTTSPQTLGTTYTLIVNGVRDLSAASNQIAPNSVFSFTILSFVLTDVGSPQPAGSGTLTGNLFDLTAGGTGIDGVADSLAYDYQQRIGDFDVLVRVQGLSPADTFTKAGIMARETLAANSRYYASVATPGISGCFFQFRSATGGTTTNAGSAPTTYPSTFLRLKRAGNTFSGYFSTDGNSWMLLSSLANQALPSQVYVGMFVASRINGTSATAQFRDFADVVGTPPVASASLPREPIGPSSRKTSFAITEIMYHPRALPAFQGRSLEFIEIFNSNPFPESLGKYRLSGSIDYTFPANTAVKGGGFVVVARDPALVTSYYGISSVLGPWEGTNEFNFSTNGLPGGEGTVRLRGLADNVLLEVNYQGGSPYPVAADGAGHSLVLSRASYGEGDPRAWGSSDAIDGSPGKDDPFGSDRLRNVVINEFLAHTDEVLVDYIELYNHGNTAVDLSGAYLSDEAVFITDPGDPEAVSHFYRFPNPTLIPARGFLSFNQTTLGFALSASGERIFLVNSNKTRVIDAIDYQAQGNGISMGRSPDGAAAWYRMASLTPGMANSAPRNDPIVINEIMYSPISGDANHEYLELYNRGGSPVNLGGWRFLDGINYTIPQGTVLTNGQYLVIAKNHTNLLARYTNLPSANTVGDYKGTLANGGERITLAMPELNVVTNNGVPVTNTIFVIVNEVTYGGGGGRWGLWADGGGSSLELRDPRSDNRQAANWADSDETAKGIWTTIAVTNAIGETLGSPINENLQIFLLGVGECLVDDVEVRIGPGGANLITANPGFESDLTGWTPQGSHDHSTIEPVGFTGAKSLHLRAASRGDNGANRVRSAVLSPIASGTVVLRARAKWIRGWPELLLRLHGGGLEIGGPLPIQPNLGTPGAPNSRLLANAGPAVYEVIHNPILPAASEPVVVTARATDPDAAITVRLKYRVEPATTHTAVIMADNGTGGDSIAGDGLLSATIPAQATGATVSFYVEAVDGLNATNTFPTDVFPTPPMTRIFPTDATSRECVIRWGDRMMPGSLPSYHVWLNNGNTTRWTSRTPRLNNAALDSTFVYNNYRVIYNMRPQYAGSPWHRGQMGAGPAGGSLVDYDIEFPSDDKLLGAGDAVWNNPGNPGGGSTTDNSCQSEQTTYLIFRELGIHYNYRRYIHIFVNGSQRSVNSSRPGNFIMEDSQQPNTDIIDEWFSGETDGQLFKIEDWFEFPDNGDDFTANNDADLSRRTIPGTANISISQYRFMFRNRARGAGELANDYTNFVNLLDIVSPASAPSGSTIANLAQFGSIVDYEQWMRIFACQHAVGNWDSYGYNRGKNAYMYKPKNGKFHQWTWDIDFTMGIGGDGAGTAVYGTTDPRITAMWNTPAILRAYLRAYEDMVNGPMNNSFTDPIIDAKSAALALNAVNYDPAAITTIKSFVTARRSYLLNTVLGTTVSSFFTASVGGQTSFTTNANLITVSGTAPVGARYIYINGINVPVTWTSVSNWTARVALSNGVNNLTVQGYTSRGTPTNSSRTLVINYTGPSADPVGSVVFNEILYNPLVPESSFVELFNNSSTVAFNIGGWEINGLDYSFPSGTVIGPRQYLVLPKNISAFSSAFGFGVIPIDDFDGDLDLDGETLTLHIPATTNSPAVVIDKVRYESQAPWAAIPPSSGASLQLIDAQQDNSRVSNWTIQQGQWLYATYTGRIDSNGIGFILFMQGSAGDVYVDDITLVTGVVAGVGMNLLQNGGFEMPLSEIWTNLGNHSNSVASTEFAHSGSSSLHVIATGPGGLNSYVRQTIAPFPTNTVCTVSFWFIPTTNGTILTLRTTPGSNFSTNALVRIPPSPFSPGAPNQVAATLPPYDPVWLNELQAENVAGITDNMGDREPWIELYNAGSGSVDLSNYYLANNYSSNLTQWQFPAGYQLAPGELRIVWADGEPLETSGTNAHTNFRLPIGNGTLALVRLLDGQPQITDYLTYNNLRANLSYGDYPDGQPFTRVVFQSATPRGTNNTRDINVFINEWMAANATFLLDTSDYNYDDWFELYNAGPNSVDLGDYYLTDNLASPKKFRVPNNGQYVIPAGGYLLVWADNDSSDNSPFSPDLHTSFTLDASFPGEALGLYSPDGVTPIDTVTFGQQTNNISEGRYADGAVNRYWMTTPTPRSANVISGGNTPPQLTAIPDRTIRLGQTVSFVAMATDGDQPPQTLTFTLSGTPPLGALITSGGQFTWTPSAAQTPGSYDITVVVADNGPGALSDMDTFTVTVLPPPVAMVSGSDGASISISFDTIPGRSYQLVYKTNIDDETWLPLNAPIPAPGTSMEITDNFGGETQRFYKVLQVD